MDEKFCNQCRRPLPADAFYHYKNGKIRVPCKACISFRQSIYWSKNKKRLIDRHKASTKEWRKRNKARVLECNRKNKALNRRRKGMAKYAPVY